MFGDYCAVSMVKVALIFRFELCDQDEKKPATIKLQVYYFWYVQAFR